MRLYRIESFYAFLLRFRSGGEEEEGRPATHDQATAKASSQRVTSHRGSSPQGERLRARRARKGGNRSQCGARKGSSCRVTHASGGRQRSTRKGLPPATRLQGGWPPATSPQGVATHGQPCRLRRGSGDGGAEGGKERAMASF
ncbi:hypothetical protein GW17_00039936 [Ensete ventricosum]|nr:hypothetical protein GW17_00039936 [Ensete ventricosum]